MGTPLIEKHAARLAPAAPSTPATENTTAIGRLMGAYALASGLALLMVHRPAVWPLLAVLHVAAFTLGFGIGPLPALTRAAARRWPRAWEVLRDWYPLLLIPFLYAELAPLNLAVWGGRFFDPLILHAEQLIFGGQPSRSLARALPYLALSEVLHGAYLSYYLIIYGPPSILYGLGRRDDFRRWVFALMLTFFVHYLFFIYFPVQGPRYIFPAPGGPIARGEMYHLAHRILAAGSSRGAAFPSSHVGVSVAATLLTIRYLPRLSPVVATLTLLLALGAVYGGFHYATDASAGCLLGIAIVLAAPAAKRLLLRLPGGGER